MEVFSLVLYYSEKIIYTLLLTVYYPLWIFLTLNLNLKIVLLKAQQFFTYTKEESEIGYFGRKMKTAEVSEVSIEEEIDFLYHRIPGYIDRITLWTAKELAKFLVGKQKLELISDNQLRFVLLNTVFACKLTWNDEKKMHELNLHEFDHLKFYQDFNYDARYIWFDSTTIYIKMSNGMVCKSDSKGVCRANYEMAKIHLQVCLTFYGPGLSHDYVHFGIPGTLSVLSKKFLSHDKVLHNLLSPHFRFTERINYQALHVGSATSNERSTFQKTFFPLQKFPISVDQFHESISRKCSEALAAFQKCQDEDFLRSDDSKVSFKPPYTTDLNLQKIPYLSFLSQYYVEIRKFVQSLEPYIDKNEWKILSKMMSLHIPNYDNFDMVDALSSFIHQSSIVHYVDHQAFYRYFAGRYGCMTIKFPFCPFDDTDSWQRLLADSTKSLSDVMKDPTSLVCSMDVMKTRCFQNIYVDYHPTKTCQLHLVETEYRFNNFLHQQISKKFINNLKKLDKRLTMTKPYFEVKTGNDEEVRSVGLQVLPVNEFIRTICY